MGPGPRAQVASPSFPCCLTSVLEERGLAEDPTVGAYLLAIHSTPSSSQF